MRIFYKEILRKMVRISKNYYVCCLVRQGLGLISQKIPRPKSRLLFKSQIDESQNSLILQFRLPISRYVFTAESRAIDFFKH